MTLARTTTGGLLGLAVFLLPSAAHGQSSDFFETKIRPVLVQHCYECHSAKSAKIRGGLRLDSREGWMRGGDSGPAIVPGNPSKSLLVEAIKHGSLKMPPKGKLAGAISADFSAWIESGAFDPRTESPQSATIQKVDAKELWSLRPVTRPAAPKVKDNAWPNSDIDRFLLAKLDAKDLKPAVAAEPHTLLRRLHYVLTGLPPTISERERFLQSWHKDSSAAVTRTVDELLASPRFGERWARHWLDLARYTDVSGSTAPVAYPQAWRYRSYVIDAFNKDKPFDRFVREQLAGDLLPAANPEEKAANLIATGYLALFHIVAADRNPEKRKLDIVDEQLDVLGRNFLGISLGCARCHNHKLDPVTGQDYYALAGIFRSTMNAKGGFGSSEPGSITLGKLSSTAPIWMRGADVKVLGVQDEKGSIDVAIRKWGDVDQLGPVVARGFPTQLGMKAVPSIPRDQSGRLQLADWLLTPENPLVSRVIVNRIWQHVFGQGLVRSTDNFGTTGDAPSHPELLDYLALRFREQHRGSFKALIKELLLSRAWQLSAQADAKALAVDPDNRLLGRANRRRQDAEALHDAWLFVTDRLDLEPVACTVPANFKGAGNQGSTTNLAIPEETLRKRAVYWPVFRKDIPVVLDMLSIFDMPTASSPRGTRAVSVVPSQALFLLNSPTIVTSAEALAVKLRTDPELTTDAVRIEHLYLRLFARKASDAEQERAQRFVAAAADQLQKTGTASAQARNAAWTRLCHTLLIANEFLVVE